MNPPSPPPLRTGYLVRWVRRWWDADLGETVQGNFEAGPLLSDRLAQAHAAWLQHLSGVRNVEIRQDQFGADELAEAAICDQGLNIDGSPRWDSAQVLNKLQENLPGYGGYAVPPDATKESAGTGEKVRIFELRARFQFSLFHPADPRRETDPRGLNFTINDNGGKTELEAVEQQGLAADEDLEDESPDPNPCPKSPRDYRGWRRWIENERLALSALKWRQAGVATSEGNEDDDMRLGAKVKAEMGVWDVYLADDEFVGTFAAHTKSEARAVLKDVLHVKHLPAGLRFEVVKKPVRAERGGP